MGLGSIHIRWAAIILLPVFLQGSSPHDSLARLTLPVSGECRPVFSGNAHINLSEVRYFVFDLGAENIDPIQLAGRMGWQALDADEEEFETPAGAVRIRSFADGGRRLLIGVMEENPGWAGMALLDEDFSLQNGIGDTPGRDLPGWPRPAPARRLLHIEGAGFEAAWYRVPGMPFSVLTRMRGRLGAAGWRVERAGKNGLVAVRRSGRDLLIMAERSGNDTSLMVATGAEK